ncbi:MAG: hypothetical protein JWP12_2179 [Bacteroidetes bacterium]|nr:hypothetical protein [Bacteroidota bacterium]
MITSFIHSFQSELIKKRRTAASWLMLMSALFMPALIIFMRMISFDSTYKEVGLKHFWEMIWFRNWAAMGMFFLPLSIILFASLITNLEFKNNTWKQLHTTPQSLTVIFFSKFAVIMLMLIQLFIVFNIGIYLSAIVPSVLFRAVAFPAQPFPFYPYLKGSFKFFIDCLPIVALQYLLSLMFKNFIVPIAAGFGLLVASLLAMNWKYGYLVPYTYCPMNFKENQGKIDPSIHLHTCALIYFVVFMIAAYILYIRKKEKG